MNLIQTWNNIRTHLAINYVLELQRVEKKFRRKMLIAYIKSKSKSLRVASINWKTNACYATGIFTRTHHRIQSAYGLVSWWFPSSFDFIATCLHTRRLISCCCTILISFFLWRSLSLFSSFFLNLCEVINVTSFSLIFRPSTAICWLYSAIARASDEDDADDEWNKNKKKIACSVCWFSV